MIKEHLEDDWSLIANCPLENSLDDVSGNNNDLTFIAGTLSYAEYSSENWINATSNSCILKFDSINQLSYINEFKLELDFVRTDNTGTYEVLIDGYDDASKYKGLCFLRWDSYWVGLKFGSGQTNLYGLDTLYSNIQLNTKYRVVMINEQNSINVKIINLSTGAIIYDATETTATYTQTSFSYFCLGGGTRYTTQALRRFHGYFKNFKLYIKS